MKEFLAKLLWVTIGWSGKKITSKFGWKKHLRENLADMRSPDGMRPPTIGTIVEKKQPVTRMLLSWQKCYHKRTPNKTKDRTDCQKLSFLKLYRVTGGTLSTLNTFV